MRSNEIPLIDFLLLGGGLASATAAETLRAGGVDGSIAILCAEATLPYHRPPLSKSFLLNGPDQTNALIHDEAFYRDREIDIHLGVRACRVDVDSRTVETDRDHFRFGKLLIATGASVDRLATPGAHLAGVHYLRTMNDALSLYESIVQARRAVVIGASFLGMELAAALVQRGVATTLIAKEDLVYEKLRSPEASEFFTEYFAQRGVELIFGEEVKELSGTTRVEGVVPNSGKVLPCDLVAIGIGVHPEVGFLANSGIDIDGGIVVDQHLETNRPGIYAAVDVANFYNPIARTRYRAEHWDNAVKQGRIAARNMLGEQQSWRTVSYFFSDVFDLTFNVVGSTEQTDERILRGAIKDKSFSVLYVGDERLRGAFLLEQSFVEAKAAGALIANRSDLAASKANLSDMHFPLNRAAVQTVLVLQGGGALGAFECGVVKALEERSIHPDLVAGVSIGAFNAAIFAANPGNATTALEAFWGELSLDTPDIPNEELRRAVSSLQSVMFGAPHYNIDVLAGQAAEFDYLNLWLEKRALPHSIPEVLARRDEIVFAEKVRRNIRTWEYIDDYRQLVEEIMTNVEPKTAEQIRRPPRYIETVGEASPLSITRINREPVEGESVSRDYEFSRASIDQLIAQGYAIAVKTLEREAQRI